MSDVERFVGAVQKRYSLSTKEAGDVADKILNYVADGLSEGEELTLAKFGPGGELTELKILEIRELKRKAQTP